MVESKTLKTQLYIVENFELDGKLDIDNLELNLGFFHTKNKRLTDEFVTFNIAGWIWSNDNNDSKKLHFLAGFTSYIDIPNKLLYNNKVVKLTSDVIDIKFHATCPDEIKPLIKRHLILKITHK